MEQKLKQKLENIASANKDLKQRMQSEHWGVSYNRKADMLSIGTTFPENSHYVSVGDGVMLRIDQDNRVYGFSIENTKLFIKENPEIGFALSLIVYPVRSYLKLPVYFLAYHSLRGFNAMKNMRAMSSLSDHIAGKALFA